MVSALSDDDDVTEAVGLSVDLDSHEVRKDGWPVRLTRRLHTRDGAECGHRQRREPAAATRPFAFVTARSRIKPRCTELLQDL
jgi:hypothetical protein